MTPRHLHILQHALGLDEYGQGSFYRNHYVTGEGCDGYDDCRALADAGLMAEHPPRELFGGDSCFVVTQAGKNAVRRESPPPPNLTRSQQRYRDYLRSDSRLKFGEWLKESSSQPATEGATLKGSE